MLELIYYVNDKSAKQLQAKLDLKNIFKYEFPHFLFFQVTNEFCHHKWKYNQAKMSQSDLT